MNDIGLGIRLDRFGTDLLQGELVEPENLTLEHLPAIRSDMSKMANWMHRLTMEMTALRQHFAGVVTIQDHDHSEIAEIKARLDPIETRLDLVD